MTDITQINENRKNCVSYDNRLCFGYLRSGATEELVAIKVQWKSKVHQDNLRLAGKSRIDQFYYLADSERKQEHY